LSNEISSKRNQLELSKIQNRSLSKNPKRKYFQDYKLIIFSKITTGEKNRKKENMKKPEV